MRTTGLPLLAALALLAAPFPRSAGAEDKPLSDDVLNFELHVMDPWVYKPHEALSKFGAVGLAERIVEEGKGWGGRVLLCITDQPPAKDLPADYERVLMDWQLLWMKREALDPQDQSQATTQAREAYDKELAPLRARMDKDLEALARKPEMLKPMMARFGGEDPKKWPPYEVETGIDISAVKSAEKPVVPAVRIVVKSVVETAPDGKGVSVQFPANDFAGTPAPCEAHMTLFLVRRKVHRLITWIWPKVMGRDREHLISDVDYMEMSYRVFKSEAAETKGGPGPKAGPDPAGPPIDPKVLGDVNEDRDVPPDLVHMLMLHKPRKFKTIEVDPGKEKDLAFKYLATERGGNQVTVDCIVYRNDAGTAPQEPSAYMAAQWYTFLIANPKGPLETAPFPTVKPKVPFLSLPDLAKKKEAARPPPTQKKKPDIQDLEHAGIATEEKQIDIGTEGVNKSWRCCMMGKSEAQGEQVYLYYGFATIKRTYFVRVFCYKDGFNVYKAELAELLGSFELFDEKDKNPKRHTKPTKPSDKPPSDKPPEGQPPGDSPPPPDSPPK